MSESSPRWIDSPDLTWSPEWPLYDEPRFAEPDLKSRAANDQPANDPAPPDALPPQTAVPAIERRSAGYLRSRLVIGLAQGVGLLFLSLAPAATAANTALGMVLLFAPLLLLAGLGRMPGKLLLPWTLAAAIAVALLGVYQYWRAPGDTSAMLIALASLFLFVGQAMMMGFMKFAARDGAPLATYPAFHDSAWRLAIGIVLCALVAAISFVLASGGFALLRQFYPGAHPNFLVTPVVTLSVAMASWLASPPLLRDLQQGVQTVLTLALPLLTLIAVAAAVAALALRWQAPLLLCLVFGGALLLCLNASYRDGRARPRWRESLEFVAAFALASPLALGSIALGSRVMALGWSGPRILAASILILLGGYAFFYVLAALIGLGGGGWMRRLERANLVMAVVLLAMLAALASPLADPARLAVAGQVQRLEHGHVPVSEFDFAWLHRDGARFGHQALEQIAARKGAPDLARGAFLALVTDPAPVRPAPTEIGANIEVRTHGARLPAALLARDWSDVTAPGVPPCLTSIATACDAYFIDLDGNGRDEILLVYGNDQAWWAGVMKQGPDDNWYAAGTLTAPACSGGFSALRAGRFAPVEPLPGWRDLMVEGNRLAVALTGRPHGGCAR